MGERFYCCEVCERSPTCENDCGSCAPEVCPTCEEGLYDRETGVAGLPNECCAIYYFGDGSWALSQWRENARHRAATEQASVEREKP